MNPTPPKNSYPTSEASSLAPVRGESSGQADQPPVTPSSSVPPVQNTPASPPNPPPTHPPPVSPPLTTNYQPPTTNYQRHFPFMMVTLFLVVVLAGFIGAYLFFSFSSNPPSLKQPSTFVPPSTTITLPSTTIIPTIPLSTNSSDLTTVPSASPSAVIAP